MCWPLMRGACAASLGSTRTGPASSVRRAGSEGEKARPLDPSANSRGVCAASVAIEEFGHGLILLCVKSVAHPNSARLGSG